MKILGHLGCLLLLFSPLAFAVAATQEWIVYVGTYTRQSSKGIYAYRFNPTENRLTPLGLAAEARNASFLAVHPNQKFLYAVEENTPGTLSSFAIDDKTGKLRLMNTVSSRGNGPCHVALDKTAKWIFAANYGNGSLASFPIHSDGTLGDSVASIQHTGSGANPQRQSGPHAHSVNISPDNRFLVVTDLGLDEVLVYRFDDKTGSLTPNDPPFFKVPSGSGPRHFVFSSDGRLSWVLNEMTATITSLGYDKVSGKFTDRQTVSALPLDFTGVRSAAEILVHPNGRFLYTSNRGHDSIATFSVDSGTGLLKPEAWVQTRGKTPRSFAIDPDGSHLLVANQDSNNLGVFRIDPKNGALIPTGDPVEAPVPVSLVFVARR